MTTENFELDGRTVDITNAEKVLFPADGLTKHDLATYYAEIAVTALPHFRDRPLTLERYPDGIGQKGFFQKNVPDHFPSWIRRVDLPKEGGTVRHMVAEAASDLVYIAGQGCITPHLGVSRIDRPERPDRLVIDLDPTDGDFTKVQTVAAAIRTELDGRNVPSFVQTTGSRGLHIVIPLRRTAGFDPLRIAMRKLADQVAARLPDIATTEQRKAERGSRVLIDTFRTAYGQTSVAPYAVRARPGAPVATPLDWSEALDPDMTAQKYTISNIFLRLGQKEDPWKDMEQHRTDARHFAGN